MERRHLGHPRRLGSEGEAELQGGVDGELHVEPPSGDGEAVEAAADVAEDGEALGQRLVGGVLS